jgi:hypothetical protein
MATGRRFGLLAVVAAAAVSAGAPPGGAAAVSAFDRSPVVQLSTGCSGPDAEVGQAVSANFVYEVWRGCGGVAFARSTDGGLAFGAPVVLPGSAHAGTDDPSISVAPDGTVYVGYMIDSPAHNYPVVVASFDDGATFPQLARLVPPNVRNWGDADALAVGPDGTVYLTWDYGPSRSAVRFICTSGGSCSFTAGDFNVVIQSSSDRGATFGPMAHVSPGFPAGGADSGPFVVERSGRIDLLYQGYRVTGGRSERLAPAYSYFTSSTDRGRTWSRPLAVDPGAGVMSDAEWWTDGAIGLDAGGDLYATWDTQSGAADTGWLAYSTDDGRRWSAAVPVARRQRDTPHITEVAGGATGTAYVGWLTDCCGDGYATYVRAYRVGAGWITPPMRASDGYANPAVWPGDTFGLSAAADGRVALSWGGALLPGSTSQIYATTLIASPG